MLRRDHANSFQSQEQMSESVKAGLRLVTNATAKMSTMKELTLFQIGNSLREQTLIFQVITIRKS